MTRPEMCWFSTVLPHEWQRLAHRQIACRHSFASIISSEKMLYVRGPVTSLNASVGRHALGHWTSSVPTMKRLHSWRLTTPANAIQTMGVTFLFIFFISPDWRRVLNSTFGAWAQMFLDHFEKKERDVTCYGANRGDLDWRTAVG